MQLISDELDEIKLKIDTLHEDLEQGAIDAIDTDINDLLSKIHGLNVSYDVLYLVLNY